MKLQRYNATTLGGGSDYRLEPDEYGNLCTDYDVEKLEQENADLKAEIEQLRDDDT